MDARFRDGDESEPVSQFNRQVVRHQLPAYLNVYHSHSGRFMGSMGNVSYNGFMLMSPSPLALNTQYDLQLYLPACIDYAPQTLTFSALSLWCRPDLTPGYYDVGFCRLDDSQVLAQLADTLRHYFTFVHPLDA